VRVICVCGRRSLTAACVRVPATNMPAAATMGTSTYWEEGTAAAWETSGSTLLTSEKQVTRIMNSHE
ncbi:hypothetical protein XENOCAPTIV_002436, partial [Xenoophorus captivus]